jgi:hypothetical protein
VRSESHRRGRPITGNEGKSVSMQPFTVGVMGHKLLQCLPQMTIIDV